MDLQFISAIILGAIALVYILKTVINQYTKNQTHTSCDKCGSSTQKSKNGSNN